MAYEVETRLFINGKFVPSSDGGTFDLHSPYDGKLVATVHEATVEDVDTAVAAAKAAFPSWSALSPEERGKPLAKLAALIAEANEELAWLEAKSMGRPISQYIDGFVATSCFKYFAEAGYTTQGHSSLNTPGFVNITMKQPAGVAAVIIPWNAPIIFFAQKLAPALMAGCTCLLKSSEKAPLTSLKIASLVEQAGFPPGVLNILSGHGPVSGAAMASHMSIRVLSFTGSTRTGRIIQKAAADSNLKNIVFELGGKSPALIFEDADLSTAVPETYNSIMWNSGQACMASSRIYVQDTIADKYIASFKALAEAQPQSMGDPLDKSVNHGPQADKIQFDTVNRYISLGKESGKVVAGGGLVQNGDSYLIHPTVFTSQPEDAPVMKEEIFGPVVTINIFHTETEAVSKANATEFGLYASVYTKDLDRAMRVSKALEAGTVGVNCTSPQKAHDMPFGGWKGSGTGRESFLESMEHYLETKAVLIKVAELK